MENRIVMAIQRYGLSAADPVRVTADRAVMFAESPEFGPVVLKLDLDRLQLDRECHMLQALEGKGACRVYAYEEAEEIRGRNRRGRYALMLQERILPGISLRAEKNPERRLAVFSKVFQSIHRQDCFGAEYRDWLDGIVKFCQMYQEGTGLEKQAKKAFSICVELEEKYRETCLLHGDLHHDNILLRNDGSYAVIDPKAVTGPAILDTPRFLLNELGMGEADEETHIRRCIRMLSQLLGYPEEDLCKAFYMETVLANIWYLEDGLELKPKDLELAERFLTE